MAYEKLYTVIGFENRPSRKALLSAENLNKMDSAINALDDRIVEMSGKADTDASDIALNRQTLGYVKKNSLKNTATTKTVNDVTFTVNEDGSVTVNGTASATATFIIGYMSIASVGVGNYIFAGNYTNSYITTAVDLYLNNVWKETRGIDGRSFEISDGDVETGYIFAFYIRVNNGKTVNNITVYPMLRSADIIDGTYEPYVDDVDTRLKKVETEVMPIERGGTGATTAKEAQYNLLNDMNTLSNEVADGTIFVNAYSSPSNENGSIYKRTALTLWNYIKSKIEGITVTNLLATVAGKPLDATMGKALNDKIETLGGFTPVIDETTGKITGYTTTIGGADTVFPFKSVVHCGSYTANGSFDVTTFGLSNVKRKNFIFVPTLTQTWVYGIATKIPYTNYEYARGFGGYKPHTFALSGNILTFTLPICTGSAYCGPTASNANVEVGEAYTLPIAGDIYYIG